MAKSLFRICGRGFFAWRAPRMWGIPCGHDSQPFTDRFIPTRVGNTPDLAVGIRGVTVHPHACGEYAMNAYLGSATDGSSPRVWGIPPLPPPKNTWPRFIPTRVGNTHPVVLSHRIAPVHPHACGEYSLLFGAAGGGAGSSPRVWGILGGQCPEAAGQRFIPTRVGNTHPHTRRNQTRPVHPHACGEYTVDEDLANLAAGSSPRVWGIQLAAADGRTPYRFIPTRVGNTLRWDRTAGP